MPFKRTIITIGNQSVAVDQEFTDDECQEMDPDMVANYALTTAYFGGLIAVETEDITALEFAAGGSQLH
jgi:hypothetical protein